MAVVSNKEQQAAENSVKEYLDRWPISPVFGFTEDSPRKPDPAMALAAAGRLGLAPAQIAFVGDTAVDMQTATAAAMIPVGALWGFRTAEELTRNGATIVLAHPAEMIEAVDLVTVS
jgi:phosphoglycolate phosphatase